MIIELWIAYQDYEDIRGIVTKAVFTNEAKALRYAVVHSTQVAKIEPGIEIREQVK